MSAAPSVHEFGRFRLDAAERLLLRSGQPVSLTPKAFDLLVYLVERHGRLVTKQELMRALWPETFVEEANLTYTVSALRKALGEREGQDEQLIQTVPTRGVPLHRTGHSRRRGACLSPRPSIGRAAVGTVRWLPSRRGALASGSRGSWPQYLA